MITDKQKDIIFSEMVFNKGLYYYSDIHKKNIHQKYKTLEGDFETNEEFVRAVHSLLYLNGLHFYSKLRGITNEVEFIKNIQSQYDLYNEYTPNNNLNWLNFTKKAIVYGFGILRIDNSDLKAAFLNWYNDINKSLPGVKIDYTEPTAEPTLKIDSLRELALFRYHLGAPPITKENCNKIAATLIHKKTGKPLKTGDKLLKLYRAYSKDHVERQDNPSKHKTTNDILRNKIIMFKKIMELLPNDKKPNIASDLKILESFIK